MFNTGDIVKLVRLDKYSENYCANIDDILYVNSSNNMLSNLISKNGTTCIAMNENLELMQKATLESIIVAKVPCISEIAAKDLAKAINEFNKKE